jgi:hypothetical protein
MVHLPDEAQIKFQFPKKLQTICLALIAAGLVLIALQIFLPWHADHGGHGEHGGGHAEEHSAHGWNPRLFYSLHLALLVVLPLTVGGIFFVAVNHLAGTMWNVTIRRVAETYWWYLPVAFVLMAIILLGGGMDTIFALWTHAPADDPLVPKKSWWLIPGVFEARNLIAVLVWALFGFLFWKQSTAQDGDGKIARTRLMAKLGGGFLVIFGLTWSMSAFDLTMSMYPHWFSTIWGIYIFAGLALTFYASMVLWIYFLKGRGYYGESVNENHLHDLGKFLRGHTIFWAYISVSQFMLIWYAHIPEETVWYQYRLKGGWYFVTIALTFVRFVLPFFLLLKREKVRDLNYMMRISILIIFGQVLDMYWATYPILAHGDFVPFSWQELGPLLFVGGSFVLIVGKMLERNALIPKKDPRLEQCLHFHQ